MAASIVDLGVRADTGLVKATAQAVVADRDDASWRAAFGASEVVLHDAEPAGVSDKSLPQGSGPQPPRTPLAARLAPRLGPAPSTTDAESTPVNRSASIGVRTVSEPLNSASSAQNSRRLAQAASTLLATAFPIHGAPSPDDLLVRSQVSRAVRRQETSALPEFDAEQVTVRTTAEGLEIHVRSLGLGADESLRCALEVARRITGLSQSLQLLVLNGSTVYSARDTRQRGELRSLDLRC